MRKLKRNIYLILFILIGSLICICGFTFAKYVSNSVWDYYLKSKGFYFSSDYLGSSVVKNVNNLWDGGSVHFNLKNNLNDAVITNYDIDYRVTCTVMGDASTYAACRMNGTTQNVQDGVLSSFQACGNYTGDNVDVSALNKTDCELGGYDWEDQVAIKDLYFDVILTDSNYELNDVVVNVTATSMAPYSKTISGDFTLHKSNITGPNVTMEYKNYSNYDKLIISNSYPSTKCVKITWDANKLSINALENAFSSYATDTNGYINEIKFNISGKNSLSYIFYRKNFNTTYNVSEFQLEETSGC
jgi:hypothetical protein